MSQCDGQCNCRPSVMPCVDSDAVRRYGRIGCGNADTRILIRAGLRGLSPAPRLRGAATVRATIRKTGLQGLAISILFHQGVGILHPFDESRTKSLLDDNTPRQVPLFGMFIQIFPHYGTSLGRRHRLCYCS
jgi:hypothetical protein